LTALPGKALCLFHDPDAAELRLQGSRAGGRGRSNAARFVKNLPTAAELSDEVLLGVVAAALRDAVDGRISSGMSRAIADLAKVYLSVRQDRDRTAANEELQQRINRSQQWNKKRDDLLAESQAVRKQMEARS
jgi:hypothetical protein